MAVSEGVETGAFTKRLGSSARKQAAQGKISVRLLEFAKPLIDKLRELADH